MFPSVSCGSNALRSTAASRGGSSPSAAASASTGGPLLPSPSSSGGGHGPESGGSCRSPAAAVVVELGAGTGMPGLLVAARQARQSQETRAGGVLLTDQVQGPLLQSQLDCEAYLNGPYVSAVYKKPLSAQLG